MTTQNQTHSLDEITKEIERCQKNIAELQAVGNEMDKRFKNLWFPWFFMFACFFVAIFVSGTVEVFFTVLAVLFFAGWIYRVIQWAGVSDRYQPMYQSYWPCRERAIEPLGLCQGHRKEILGDS